MHRIIANILFAFLIIAIITIISLPFLLLSKRKGKDLIRQFSYIALFCSFFLILFATIFITLPITFQPEQYVINVHPFLWLREEDVARQLFGEVIPNILLFIPLGLFLPIVFEKLRKLHQTGIVVFLITFSIEMLQFFIGRLSDIDDLTTNLLGGLLGYGIFKVSNHFFSKKRWWKRSIGNELEDAGGK